MRFEVTPQDVRQGVRGSWGWNPVARAVLRLLPRSDPVLAGDWWWLLDSRGDRVRARPPAAAVGKLTAYQKGEGMTPFAFEMEAPG